MVYGINERFTWISTGKPKTLDLALGPPVERPAEVHEPIVRARLSEVWVACEAKSVMTEHGKSQPRVYDELNSSHDIVHQGQQDAISAGITVVNIAERFASPLRQVAGGPVVFSLHNQPRAAERMIRHLRGLPIRDAAPGVGFDAYATVVINCDNVEAAQLWRDPPAPQPGDPDYYLTFLERISRLYAERFG